MSSYLQTMLDEDTPLVHKKSKDGQMMTKKARKAKKLEQLERKIRDGSSDSLEAMESSRAGNTEWSEGVAASKREALPVIRKGKVVRVLVDAPEEDEEQPQDGEEELDEFKVMRMRKGKAKREALKALAEQKKKKAKGGDGDKSTRNNGGDSGDDNDSDSGSDGGGEYDFRPEFKSTAEALEDYGELDEAEQKDTLQTKANKRKLQQQKRKAEDSSDEEDEEDAVAGGDKEEDDDEENEGTSMPKEKEKEKMSRNALLTRKKMHGLSKMSPMRIKAHIATISRQILAAPEEALKKSVPKQKRNNNNDRRKGGGSDSEDDDEEEEEEYKMTDLFDILLANTAPVAKIPWQHKKGAVAVIPAPVQEAPKVFPTSIIELTMLSLLLIFKDICPGYKIRPPQDNASMQDVKLKKETKRLRDFEFALLGAYQRYLKFLNTCVANGLGNPRKEVQEWNSSALLGVSALRCQGELLKAVPYFNFRSSLLASMTSRAAQPSLEVYSVACSALEGMFEKDKDYEATLEVIKSMGGVLSDRKAKMGTLPEPFLKVLFKIQLHVRADDAKDLKKAAKKEKRKRKRAGTDDVATKMLESNSEHDKLLKNKNQAQCLHEVLLLYFRVIKGKIGFRLLPLALEGLSRVSHLINTDTVEDLIAIMRDLLENPAAVPPPEVRVQCVLCALRTLNGPGEELTMDMDFFASALLQLLKELRPDFEKWDYVLECVDICMVRKREERTTPIVNFVKTLFFLAPQLPCAAAGVAMLTMAHRMLLRYPRIRARLRVFASLETKAIQEDDEVGDLAMLALKAESSDMGRTSDAFASSGSNDDGTWMLPLMNHHIDPQYEKVVAALTNREIVPLPLRFDAAICSEAAVMDRMESSLTMTPPTLRAAINKHLRLPADTDLTKPGGNSKEGKKTRPDKHQRILIKKLSSATPSATESADVERSFVHNVKRQKTSLEGLFVL
jgi:hypothetical protein